MTNKRVHKRVPISAVAVIHYEKAGENRVSPAMAGSISFGGIGLYADDRIDDGTEVSITLQFISTNGSMETETVEGHVVYSKTIGDMHFMGIRFEQEIGMVNSPPLYNQITTALRLNDQVG
ncbi:MAG: PilZ domain-containing protein [Nitrospirae bacterium]|nr:PilZ domain-containing protein [Nitrospirota bacterium]